MSQASPPTTNPDRNSDCPYCGAWRFFNLVHQCGTGAFVYSTNAPAPIGEGQP